MANQRMFIRCRACGAEKFMAKHFMDAFRTIQIDGWQEEWDEWFEEHQWGFCDPEGGEWSLDCFELSYEHHIEGQHTQSNGGA